MKKGKPWRRGFCRLCARGYMNAWRSSNVERVQRHRKDTYERRRDAHRAMRKIGADPAALDAVRRALVERPPVIEDDSAAVAYFRGFLAGAGRAQSEAQDVEELKDLVFRIAAEEDSRMRSWLPERRLSYEDMVSIGYEALLECLRKKRKDRGLVATAIRRRFQDEARERFGRGGHGTEKKRDTLGRSNYDDEEGETRLRHLSDTTRDEAEDNEYVESLLGRLSDPRTREIVRRRADGETFREIGETFGITESRACQLFGIAREQLEAALR